MVPVRPKLCAIALHMALCTFAVAGKIPPTANFTTHEVRPRMVGGNMAGPFLTRHLANVIISYEESHEAGLCTATVIAPRWLLTAAHCFTGPGGRTTTSPGATHAFIGESSSTLRLSSTSKEPFWARKILVHKGYKPGTHDHRHDVALIFLEQAVPRDRVQTVQLAAGPHWEAKAGSTVSAAGYGTLGKGRGASGVLMKAALVVKPFAQCARRESATFRPFVSAWAQVCGVSVGWPRRGLTDTCYGDSGGPMFHWRGGRIVQFGITSFGSSACAAPGSVTWYTRVAAFHKQIQQAVREGNAEAWKSFA